MELFNPRLGAVLRSFSTDPLTAQLGAQDVRAMDEMDLRKKEDEQKAKELKQGMFLELLKNGISNGVDEPTLQKFASGAGLDDVGGLRLGGINKNDPMSKRAEHAARLAGKFEPATIDAWVQSGRYTDLKPVAEPEKNVVLQPQSQLVDPVTGEVKAENKNTRATPRQTNVGYKQQIADRTLANNEKIRAGLNPERLSDRVTKAKTIIEDKVAQGLVGTPEAANMRKALNARVETLTKFDNAAGRMMDILTKNPTAATVGADAARAAISTAAQAKGLLNLIPGADLTDVDLDETDWSEQLNQIAGDNAELRSTMFSIAMLMATADGLAGGRLTNQMVDQALANVGASGRSPRALKRKLSEARKRVADSLETTLSGTMDDYSALDRPDPTAQEQTGPKTGAVEDGYQFMGGDPKDKKNWRKI